MSTCGPGVVMLAAAAAAAEGRGVGSDSRTVTAGGGSLPTGLGARRWVQSSELVPVPAPVPPIWVWMGSDRRRWAVWDGTRRRGSRSGRCRAGPAGEVTRHGSRRPDLAAKTSGRRGNRAGSASDQRRVSLRITHGVRRPRNAMAAAAAARLLLGSGSSGVRLCAARLDSTTSACGATSASLLGVEKSRRQRRRGSGGGSHTFTADTIKPATPS